MANRREHSYGIIPLKKKEGVWNVLLVQLHAGHWGFPKGHPNNHETTLDTAQRELFEETGLTVAKLLSDQTLDESYFFKFQGDLIQKKVTYYIAEVKGHVKKMVEEIKDVKWVPLSDAADYLSFEQGQNIARQTSQILSD